MQSLQNKEEVEMCKIIAICNQKGGVGKTTTALNLGIGLAREGKKVLLIDADAQGNLTSGVGIKDADGVTVTLAQVMNNIINDIDFDAEYGIIHHEENVDLLPANIELATLEVLLVNAMRRELVLRDYVNRIKEQYDYILIDCMPSLGMITVNALACADSILIPVQASYFSMLGLQQLFRTIGKIKKGINPKLEIEGILITRFDVRTNLAKDIADKLGEAYGDRVKIFDSIISASVKIEESIAEGKSIYIHSPSGKVAAEYGRLVLEVMDNE